MSLVLQRDLLAPPDRLLTLLEVGTCSCSCACDIPEALLGSCAAAAARQHACALQPAACDLCHSCRKADPLLSWPASDGLQLLPFSSCTSLLAIPCCSPMPSWPQFSRAWQPTPSLRPPRETAPPWGQLLLWGSPAAPPPCRLVQDSRRWCR